MAVIDHIAVATLRILSVEDEPETIAGNLDQLELDGHFVARVETIDEAEESLAGHEFNFLILDQRAPWHGRFDFNGGSTLVRRLKEGAYGERNRDVAFVFVVGSVDWVNEAEVSALEGFRRIERKGGPLTPILREHIEGVRSQLGRRQVAGEISDLRRVLIRVVGVGPGTPEPVVQTIIPSWSPDEVVSLPLSLFAVEDGSEDKLVEKRFFGWINLGAPDAAFLAPRDFEEAEPLDEESGLL
jgi:CheY-like chemotaxis protein